MKALPAYRRMFAAMAGVAIAALLLRSQLSDSLVLRGDACWYAGNVREALRYYGRAVWIDDDDGVAVDRLSFVAMTARDRFALRESTDVASRFLRRHPDDDVVRLDRAMAYRAMGDRAHAFDDFVAAGLHAHDPRALTFAGYAAAAQGRSRRARSLWRTALAFSPAFVPAARALARWRNAK
jgi:tetratricopeptide (TPR) repeat protein